MATPGLSFKEIQDSATDNEKTDGAQDGMSFSAVRDFSTRNDSLGAGSMFVSGLNPFGGQRPDKNTGLIESSAFAAGEAIQQGLVIGKGLSGVNKVYQGTNKGLKIASDIIQGIKQSYVRGGPLKSRFIGGEALIGVGTGGGEYYARQKFPDSGIAEFVGGLGGGLITDVSKELAKGGVKATGRGIVSAVPKVHSGAMTLFPLYEKAATWGGNVLSAARRGVDPSPSAARMRARERLARQGITEESVADINARANSAAGEMLPGSAERMSFSMLAAEPKLLKLEADVVKNTNKDLVSDDRAKRLVELNDIIRQGFDFGDVNSFRSWMGNRQKYYKELLDAQLQSAAVETERRLKRFNVDAPAEEQANLIARSALDNSLKSARATEKELWSVIPADLKVSSDKFAAKWQELQSKMTKVSKQTDSPITAQWFTKIPYGKHKNKPRIGQFVSVQEARDIISHLRSEARNATSAFGETNFRLANIANELATSINDDLGDAVEGIMAEGSPYIIQDLGTDIVNDMENAVAFTRELNEVYRRPEIAGLFAKTETGAKIIPDTRVLDHLFADPKANRENFDALMTAVDSNPAVAGALEDYLKYNMFKGQGFNTADAQTFLKDNDRLLSRMPDFKRQIRQAVETDDIDSLTSNITEGINAPMAAATIFVKEVPEVAIATALKNENPGREMASILRMAKADKTGNAEQGLKQAYADYLMNISERDFASTGGNRWVDYNLLEEALRKDSVRGTMRMIFSPEDMSRWNKLRATAKRVQLARESGESVEGIREDLASAILTTAARIGGARLGGTRLGGMSVGGSIQAAGIASGAFKTLVEAGINNPSEAILSMAVMDQNLFNTLFKELTSEADIKEAQQTMNALTSYIMKRTNKLRGVGSVTSAGTGLFLEGEEQQQ